MASKSWSEVLFGTAEDRQRAKDVLKEMRPKYDLPGANQKPKFRKETRPDSLVKGKSGETKTAVLGGSGVQAYGSSKKNTLQLGANESERRYFTGNKAPPKPKPRPAQPRKKVVKAIGTAAKKEVKPRFYGNWVGATPTPMQARAGMPRKKK